MTSSEHEVHYLDHVGGGYNYGVPSSEVTGGHPQITPKLKRKRTEASRIKVCVRKRPLSKREEKREKDVVEVDGDGCGLLVKEEKLAVDLRKVWLVHKFQFDEVFSEDISNKGVYERTAKLFLPFVLKGGKATCFAFGQTGAGKTHTLLGDRNGKGLYQFAAEDLFECLRAEAECDGVVVWISYFEIYCGQLYDLLNKRERIQALENGKHQVCITGVNEVPVNLPQTLNQFIEQGNGLRSQGSSGVNTSSSRSHAVLQMQLKDVTGNRLGRLSFIDLAGSERACDRGEPDKTTRLEGAEINTSLLALKECIRAMDQEHTHTPFRQSKLTQVLRDSFMGQSLTCMVASISPGSSALEHTLNTLRYADRVKEIHKLAYNSHQFSSAPKNFTPNNTSTPLKPQKSLRPSSLTPRRTSLPAQNLQTVSTPDVMVKRRSSMQTNSPKLNGTLEVGSESKRSPRRKVKQKSKINRPVDGKEEDKNHQKENQSNGERIGRSIPVVLSPAIHREVVGGEAVKLRRQSQHQEKDGTTASSTVEEIKETSKHRIGIKSDRERVLREKEIKEEKLSGDGGLVEEQDENMRREKMVRNFLSNSLPVWEDEKVIEKTIPSPNLSIGWEIENPHYIEVRESVKDEGQKEEQDLNNNSKEFDIMRFENPRYVGRKSNPRFELTVAEDKYEEGRNVELNQNFQSLTDHFAREAVSEYVSRDNGMGPGDDLKKEEREGAGSPRSIATDSTMELLAEIDQSLRNSSVSPVPDLARRYTVDGVSHDDLLRDVNRLTASSSFTRRVTLSTEYQESVMKTKMKKRKENFTHQGGEMSSNGISEMEKMNRGSPLRVNLKRKGTEGNKDKVEVRDIRRKEPVSKPADAERSEKRLGEIEGRHQSRNGPFHDRGGRENKNRQERNDAESKVEGKVGEMQRKDVGWEMKQHYVLEDRGAGINHEPRRDTINASTRSQHGSYSPIHQYEGTRNETEVLPYSVSHSKTNNSEGKIDEGGRVLNRDVDTSAAKETTGGNVGVFVNGYDIDYSNNFHEGMDVHSSPHRSHRICDGDTMVQNPVDGIEDYTMHKNRSRLGMNKEGDTDSVIMERREFEVRDGEGSGTFTRQNNSQNHKRRNVNGSNIKEHYRDISEENGNDGLVEVSLGRLQSKHGIQDQEEATKQLQIKNNPSKHERRPKVPAGKSVDKVEGSKSRSLQNDFEPKGNELLVVKGPRSSKEVDLGEEVVSENEKDLKLSHNLHSSGEWCECCSVLEQMQLWNREGADKQEEEMKERLGLKEQKVMDQHRRASLNQGSESPSRRRRNLKQRNSLPWIGAPRFTNQEDFSGREGGTESVEYVIRRVQTDGQVGGKDCDNSANVFTSFTKLTESGKESKKGGAPDREHLPQKRGSLAKESVEAGESDSLKYEKHVSFQDVPKRGTEVKEQLHHSPSSVLVTSDEKHRKIPRPDEKGKPLSPDLSVYSTGGYIPTVFAVAQNNESLAQVSNNLGKSGKKKRKSLKEKMSEKGIESLPSPKGFPSKTEMAKLSDKDISRNEVSHTETSSNSRAVTTWAESAERRQRSNRKEGGESFFLKDVENEDPMTPGSQGRESTHQQVAFYRETYQPLSNQWQHVRNDGRSPVVKVKLSSSNVSRDSDKHEEGDGVLMDRSNVAADTGITKSNYDNQNFSLELTQQENGWIQSRRRLEETENYVNGATDRMEKKSKGVENNSGKDQGGQGNRNESITHERLDVIEVERVQFRIKGEVEDSRTFEERVEVSSKWKEKEPLKRKEEETGCKERTNVVTEIDGYENITEKFSERHGYELLVQESEIATQQMVGVRNLDIESSWVGHHPLSPIPEGRSDEDGEVRNGPTDGATEESPTQGDHIRPNSALEKATEHRNLSRDMVLKDRHLLVRAHQEQLEELQQLCDSGWNLINKLQLGQGDVYEYLSDSDVLLDSQERCIKTFKDQLAMYTSCSSPAGMMMNGVVEHTNRRS
ncbi:Kinesin-like protein KIF24 [Holothuria leucospilota]|uniref:Kinesin-like protein KIF24 n=1 Tax=Holothuria leucospilota TaxID=206669 RepID=A0A9Q1H0F5_HOLLE|nr:Kinesin-like protein KIF24 [Holothuria leucospilota]